MIKGGVWKNTEDEILKAAIMKYGLNQWARISSLLVRKSAKQCKARWYEWLDPSIKKTEWSQEEDEKLLHLAKIMPCQWRSIAPIVGRTSAQCLERYEHLLDSVQSMQIKGDDDNDDDEDQLLQRAQNVHTSSSNIRRLRPGEIDPNPETKPARPDAIDMDEDEKEMLSEARARLANTKGKKAKRKAREKQLEQARRLASLQKRRELKAAGIHLRKRRKRKYKYLQYNNEIPFYRKAPRGFWDTTKDDLKAHSQTEAARKDFKPMFITEIEGERRDDIEERERKKDIQRQKLLKKINLPELVMRLNQNGNGQYLAERKKLNLPQPQISEAELQDIAKLSKSETAGNLNGATPSILRPGSVANGLRTPGTPSLSMGKNVRTPSSSGRITEAAVNALRMKNTQTPLLGGDNVELYDDDFDGITPRSQAVATPNINALTNQSNGGTAGTVDHGASVMSAVSAVSGMSAISTETEDPRKRKKREKRKRKRLRSEFESLPAPEYEYKVALPKLPEKPFVSDRLMVIDAADRDAMAVEEAERENEAMKKKQSEVIQRGLPRPKTVNAEMRYDDRESAAAEMLRKEMMDLIYFDAVNGDKRGKKMAVRKEEMNPVLILKAKKLLEAEMKAVAEEEEAKGLKEEMDGDDGEGDEYGDGAECIYIPKTGFRFIGNGQSADGLDAKKQEFNILHRQIMAQRKKMETINRKIAIKEAGYDRVRKQLTAKNANLRKRLHEMTDELKIYEELEGREQRVIPQRISKWERLIEVEKERQRELQRRYETLQIQHDALLRPQ